MKKEIIECINNKILQNKKKQQEQYEKDIQREKVEASVRKSLLKTIEKFFDGLPKNSSYRINLTERNDMNNPRDITQQIGSITYPIYTFLKPDFKEIGYDIIDIEVDGFGRVSIDGFNFMGIRYNYDYKDNSHTSWNFTRLQAFVKALDWIEEQIAKEYGCSKDTKPS